MLRLLDIQVGDEYSEHALVDAQRDLYQSDLFRHVEVRLAPDSAQGKVDSLVTVDVVLSENFVRQVDTEVGWAVLDCFKGRALLVDKNFLGEARRLELTAQVSKIGHAENDAVRGWEALRLGHEPGPVQQPRELLHRQHVPPADAVRAARIAGHLGVQRAARRVSGVPAHDRRRRRSVADARAAARAAAAAGVFARVRPHRRAARAAVRRVQPMRQRVARPAHRPQPAARGGERAPRSRAHRQPAEPTHGHDAATRSARRRARRSAPTRTSSSSRDSSTDRSIAPSSRGVTFAARLRLGSVLGRSFSFSDSVGFVPPEERLYAGGAASVRGFQQNELGDLIYIAEDAPVVRRGERETPSISG